MTEEEKLQAALCVLLGQMESDNPGLIDRLDAINRMKKAGYDFTELDTIWKRYLKHAGPLITITVYDLYMKSIQKGFSDRAAKVAIRLGLSVEYGEHEYFTAADLAAAIGVSEEEADQMIENSPGAMKISLEPWITEILSQ